MKLNKVTKAWLKSFAGDKIYQRGTDYFQSGMVYQMEYYPENLEIHAKISGNYGNYEVNVTEEKQKLNAYCDCPYEGYPCKHIVAVLLSFIENKREHEHQAVERRNFFDSLQERLSQYSHEQLVHIIIEAAQNYPDFKRELTVNLEPDDSSISETILNQLRYIRLDDFENGSELEKIRALKKVMKSVKNASARTRVIINWGIADKVLNFLNQYGISDERWEDLVFQTFETLSSILSNSSELEKEKEDILEQLQKYYDWGNCSMGDDISELMEKLSS